MNSCELIPWNPRGEALQRETLRCARVLAARSGGDGGDAAATSAGAAEAEEQGWELI